MNREYDEIALSSYIDGELDPESFQKIEAFIEKDAHARKYVLNAVKTAARLRASMNGVLSEKIPERLTRTVLLQQNGKARRSSIVQPLLRFAAAVLLILLGFGAANLIPTTTNDPIASLAVPFAPGYSRVLGEAMEHNLSGISRQWQSPEKRIITVTPVQTYRDKTGRYYREFRMEVQTAGNRLQIGGIAYRQKGEWKAKAVYFQ